MVDLTLVTDSAKWIKEDTHHFYSTGEGRKAGAKKYSYKYPYVYGASEGQMTVRNIGVIENDVLLRIYGPAQDPAIKIGDNLYQINTTLEANERLEIDTMKKKAVKITAHGDEINVFNDRNKDNRLYVPTHMVQILSFGTTPFRLISLSTMQEASQNGRVMNNDGVHLHGS